jgi:DNA polymerase V
MREKRRQLGDTSPSPLEAGRRIRLPLYLCRVPAGFPSPAGDYVESQIDLNEWLIRNEPSTFVARVEGDSMEPGICSGDWLIVDRSLDARHRDVIVAGSADGVTVKRLLIEDGRAVLSADNPAYPPVKVEGDEGLRVWGVVTYVVRRLR